MLLLLAWTFLFNPPVTYAQTISGIFGVSVTNPSGSSSYSIQYSYPREVEAGQTLKITVIFYVNQLSGLKLFASAYNISALIGLNSGGFIGTGSVGYWPPSTFLGASGNLYPGSHWGPKVINVTVGTPPSSGSNSSAGFVSIGLVTKVSTLEAVGAPAVQESGSKIIGPVTIVGSGSPLSLTQFLFPAIAVAAVALGGVYWFGIRSGHRRQSVANAP